MPDEQWFFNGGRPDWFRRILVLDHEPEIRRLIAEAPWNSGYMRSRRGGDPSGQITD